MFQLGQLKALGPNSFNKLFYQRYWSLIGTFLTNVANHFMTTRTIPSSFNTTNTFLLPKVKCPSDVSQLQSISLCNFAYKIIAEILSNRLQPFLNQIISPFQNAFTPDGAIRDNIIMTHEAFHFLKLKRKQT